MVYDISGYDENAYVLDIILTVVGDEIEKRSPSIIVPYKHRKQKHNADDINEKMVINLTHILKTFQF